MNNFLLSIGFLLIFVLSVLFAGPHFVDWNQYRHTFEAQASKIIGREVRVGGKVSLRLLPTPFIRFENVRIADQDGRFADPFLKMTSFRMLLNVPPLLKGDVEASGIELNQPRFHLVIDDDQGPNWKGLGAGDNSLPVMPKNVAFKSVKITDGQVVLKVSGNKKILQLDKVDVNLSAASIAGPYKLHGTYYIGGKLREVAMVTGDQKEDGALHVQTKFTNPENRATYEFDGLVKDGASDPSIDGQLHAILPISGSGFALPVDSRMKRAVGGTADLKAKLTGNVREFKLDDLTISFESDGRPQSLRGKAKIDWQDGLAVNSQLHAIWLDLDRIAGYGGKKVRPWNVLKALLGGLEGSWPAADKVDVTVRMDQATLGGDAVDRLAVRLFKSERELLLKNFSADLPGMSNIRMSGRIVEGDQPAFIGDVVLRGRSFKRFRRWALQEWLEALEGDDGYFALNGRLDASGERMMFTNFKGEYEETIFTGEVSYQFTSDQLFDISIDSEKIDLRQTVSEDLTISHLSQWWSDYLASVSGEAAKGAKSASPEWGNYFKHGRLALKIGQLLMANEQFRDVDIDLKLAPKSIGISRGQFETRTGAQFKIDGGVNFAQEMPRGKLNILLEALELRSVRSVARFLDLPGWFGNIEALSPELAPFRLAGVVKIGTRDGLSTEASLDGSLGTTRATLLANLTGSPLHWRTGQVDLVGFLKSVDGTKLLAQIFSSSSDQFSPGDLEGDKAPGRLALRLSGVPEKGMATIVDLEAPGLKAEYRGNLTLADDNIQIEGEFALDAQNAGNALKLVRLEGLLAGGAMSSASGKGLIIGEAGVFQISDGQIRLGNTEYRGSGSIEFGDGVAEVHVVANTNTVSLPELMNVVVAARVERPVSDEGSVQKTRDQIASVEEIPWTDRPFNFDVLERFSGSLELASRRIDLGQGYKLGGGALKFSFAKDALHFQTISGKFGGGVLSASVDIKRAAAGVTITGQAQLKDADLREFKRDDASGEKKVRKSVAQGSVNLSVNFAGRGLSPRGVMAVLNGEGKAEFKDLALMHFSPQAVEIASNALLTSERRPRKEVLEQSIIDNLSKGVTRIGARAVNFKIADGTVTFDRQMMKKTGTDVTVTTYLDLNRLLLDSEWIIKPKVNIKAKLQPVSIVYNGALKNLSTLKPRIDVEQLSRELVVRRLELDVEALEALRKRDDELAREAEKARAEQGTDWGVTETIIDNKGAAPVSDGGNGVRGTQSGAAQSDAIWQSSVAPVGPYGSAYDPMENAISEAPRQLEARPRIAKKRRVRKKKVKKKYFNPFFQY